MSAQEMLMEQISSGSISKSSFRAFAWDLARQSGVDWSEFLLEATQTLFIDSTMIPSQCRFDFSNQSAF